MSSPDLIFQVKNTLYNRKPDTGLIIAAGAAVPFGATGTLPAFMAGPGATGERVITYNNMVSQVSSLKIYEGTKHTINIIPQ